MDEWKDQDRAAAAQARREVCGVGNSFESISTFHLDYRERKKGILIFIALPLTHFFGVVV
jgi:hypothetical protein